MIRLFSRRTILIVAVIILILLACLTALYFVSQGNKTKIETVDSTTQKTLVTEKKLTINGLSDLSTQITNEDQQLINDKINSYLSKANVSNTFISAQVRENSLKTETNDLGTVTTFMIDIPDLKRSYSVSDSNGGSNGYNGLNILCPTDSQRIYPKFDCKDDLSE